LSLYEEGSATPLDTATYVNGDVVFEGFSSVIAMNDYKVYVLKANTNASGNLTQNTTTAFVVKSDSNTDIEARSDAGSLLGTAEINYNSSATNGSAEVRFATGTSYIFHDAYPTMSAASLGTTLPLDSQAKIFKFSVTNSGTRDLRFASTSVAVTVSGLATGGAISDFRLYEDNGSGGLGTYTAQYTTTVNSSTSNPVNVNFNAANAQNNLLTNFVIAPGTTRTFIVTADTTSMLVGKTTGSVTVSAKISGSTGWSGTAWNTGNLFYYYTPVNGSELGPFSASNSYDVSAGALTYAL
jgi:hypothetical protein